MKTLLTRREHIVPRFYLENFCDAEGRLFVYEKDKEIRRNRSANECAERDFYEYNLPRRQTKNVYERWLGRIESDANAVLPLIAARDEIDQAHAETWAVFVASLFVRTRKVRAQISNEMTRRFREHTRTSGFVRDLQYELLKAGHLAYTEDLEREVNTLLTDMEASPSFYHVSGLPQNTRALAEAVLHKNWFTVDAAAGTFFVTSDCPVITVQRNPGGWGLGAGFGSENVAVLLPLSPHKLFIASQFGWNTTATPAAVHSANLAVLQFAHRCCYAHVWSLEVKALVDSQINNIVFGRNAFLPKSGTAPFLERA